MLLGWQSCSILLNKECMCYYFPLLFSFGLSIIWGRTSNFHSPRSPVFSLYSFLLYVKHRFTSMLVLLSFGVHPLPCSHYYIFLSFSLPVSVSLLPLYHLSLPDLTHHSSCHVCNGTESLHRSFLHFPNVVFARFLPKCSQLVRMWWWPHVAAPHIVLACPERTRLAVCHVNHGSV